VKGKRPILALVVDIDDIFFHCAKAFLRSGLWDPETWDPDHLPKRAVIAKQVENDPRTLAEMEDYYRTDTYSKHLY
jgi:predicted pyridoxine 5'-phosphate oxidase superfamily flavin-nucleotide-binding protein